MLTDEQRVYFRRDDVVRVTNRILTRGNLIEEGWSDGKRWFVTQGYPGALNYFSIEELPERPPWAAVAQESTASEGTPTEEKGT